MDKSDFRNFQLMQLSLLDEFARLCENNDLRYFMIGGTLLGAIRHQGFIPWDPDIDVAMLRVDYDKFLRICNQITDTDKYFLATFQNEKDHYSPHARFHLNHTEIVSLDERYLRYKYHKGVYMDIFPLDDAPNDKSKQIKQAKRIKTIRKIMYYKQAVIYDKNASFVKRTAKSILRLFMKLVSLKHLQTKMEAIMKKYDVGGQSPLVGHMTSHYDYQRVLYHRDIYCPPRKYLFEGKEYYGPNNATEYLRQLYGDYEKLPSLEKQKEFYAEYDDVKVICTK